MTQSFFREYTLDRGSESYDITIEVEVYSWGCAAQTYGPPENCWPAEPMELGIIDCWIDAPTWARGRYSYDTIPFALTDTERWKLEERVICFDPPERDEGYNYE